MKREIDGESNQSDLEKAIAKLPTPQPSEHLDQRMQQLFQPIFAEKSNRNRKQKLLAIGWGITVCIAAMLGFVVGSQSHETVAPSKDKTAFDQSLPAKDAPDGNKERRNTKPSQDSRELPPVETVVSIRLHPSALTHFGLSADTQDEKLESALKFYQEEESLP